MSQMIEHPGTNNYCQPPIEPPNLPPAPEGILNDLDSIHLTIPNHHAPRRADVTVACSKWIDELDEIPLTKKQRDSWVEKIEEIKKWKMSDATSHFREWAEWVDLVTALRQSQLEKRQEAEKEHEAHLGMSSGAGCPFTF